jgi:hypothetical protein
MRKHVCMYIYIYIYIYVCVCVCVCMYVCFCVLCSTNSYGFYIKYKQGSFCTRDTFLKKRRANLTQNFRLKQCISWEIGD